MLPISENVDVDELADTILDTCARGAHAWITFSSTDAEADTLRLLVGPGIPVAIISE
ncbi:hypothetical protein [Paenarthrobacter ureafaciens]|uniref:hypothetical protein n=1 Tax=Paenarthrobacter ureafaciens TaxID=37931 RepID=UPI0015B83BA1|nr:hypothetical protein [Paenarthrobacter ureafaciens]